MSTLVVNRLSGTTIVETRALPPEPVISKGSFQFIINLPREWIPVNLVEWDLQYQKSADNSSFGDWIDLGTFSATTGLGDIAATADTESGTGGSYVHPITEPPPASYYRYRYRLRTSLQQSDWSEAGFAGQGQSMPLLPLPAPSVVTPDSVTESEIASGTITSDSIQAGTIVSGSLYAGLVQANLIKAQNISAGTITANEIAANTITAAKIVAGTITATQIAAATITSTQIAASTITATNIAASTITGSLIAGTTITGSNIVSGTITSTQIAATTITASNIVANTITAAQIAAATITSTQIAAGTITAGNIAASTITGGLIAAGTITATNIAAATLTGSLIAANTITGSNLVAGTITATQISVAQLDAVSANMGVLTSGTVRIGASGGAKVAIGDSISTSAGTKSGIIGTDSSNNITFIMDSSTGSLQLKGDIQTGSTGLGNITGSIDGTTNINSASINNSRLIANTITAAKIAAGTITTTEIAALTITAGNIAAGTITAAKITAGTITSNEIATDTITAGNIAANAITTSELNALAVTAAKIAANTITAGQIAAGTITATEIAGTTITAAKIAANTITAGQIAAGTITATEIAAGAITASKISVGLPLSVTLRNGAFSESNLADGAANSSVPGWTTSVGNGGTIQTDATFGRTMRLVNGTLANSDVAQVSVTLPVGRHVLSGWLKTTSVVVGTGQGAVMTSSIIGATGTVTAHTAVTGTTGWTYKETVIDITVSGTVNIDLALGVGGTVTGTAEYANIALKSSINSTTIVPGAITTTQLSATAIDAMTITGATFRTSSGSSRVEINGTNGFFITTDNAVTKDILLDSTGLQLLATAAETVPSQRKIRFLHTAGGATAGEMYNTSNTTAVPSISNSNFDTNLTGWTLDTSSGTVTRDTTTFQAGTGSFKIVISVISSPTTGGYTTFSGTFKAGITYRIPFYTQGLSSVDTSSTNPDKLALYTDSTFATLLAYTHIPNHSGSFVKSFIEFKPMADVVNPVLRITWSNIGTLYVDTIGPVEIMTTAITTSVAKAGGNDVAAVGAQVVNASGTRLGSSILTSEGKSDFLQLTSTSTAKMSKMYTALFAPLAAGVSGSLVIAVDVPSTATNVVYHGAIQGGSGAFDWCTFSFAPGSGTVTVWAHNFHATISATFNVAFTATFE